VLSVPRGLALFRGIRRPSVGLRLRAATRDEFGAISSLVAARCVENVHVGAALWTQDAFLAGRHRGLWSLREGGRLVGVLQHCRGISWALREGTVQSSAFSQSIADYLARAVALSEVIFGREDEVSEVLESCRPRGVYPLELRRQVMMAVPRHFAPVLPATRGAFALRRAVHDDLPWLLSTHAAMCIEDLGVDQVARNPRGYRRYFRELIAGQQVFVGEIDGARVFKVETPLQSEGAQLIEGVYTCPDARGRGCASRAVASLAIGAAREGQRACLYVHRRNEVARSVYRRIGFRRICSWTTAVISADGRAPLRPATI